MPITKFDALYAGYVDLDDVGWGGMPVNDRHFPDERLASVLDKTVGLSQAMDKNGYEAIWLAEHHFNTEGYECIPNLLMLSLHLSQHTERLKFGCGFNVTPMWHPLRLAEDFATVDILTGGRVIFGVGRGYHTREVETFGAPLLDQGANRELFEEQVEIIFKAFNEESFSHHGKHYDLPPKVPYRGYELEKITMVPRPTHLPVETYQPIVSASPRGLDFMAKYGIKGIYGGGAGGAGEKDKVAMAWRDALARHGRETELGTDLIMAMNFQLADTKEKAIKEAKGYFEENIKMFAPLGMVPGISDAQLEAMGDRKKAPLMTGVPTVEDAIGAKAWYAGPPEGFIELLMELQEGYPGLERVLLNFQIGTPQAMMVEQLDWFAKEVMPAFTAKQKNKA